MVGDLFKHLAKKLNMAFIRMGCWESNPKRTLLSKSPSFRAMTSGTMLCVTEYSTETMVEVVK